ncbi:MAG: hypothetical protein FJZ78_02540 [Bacteroidetes bacterium]|nr:hypothetical protein [Bacteroidota bacterium]
MKVKSLLAAFFSIIYFAAFGQADRALSLLSIEKPVFHTSIDRLGNFYFLSEGMLTKTDGDGKVLAVRKDSIFKEGTFLEAWNPLRIILHHRRKHAGLLLGQNLESYQESVNIDPAFALAPLLIGNGLRSELVWVLDEDYSLKEIDLANMRMLTESPSIFNAEEKRNFFALRLYQNFLFLLEKDKGLHILSRTGKLLRTIATPFPVFGVLGEDFYYREQDQLTFEDIYSGDRYSVPLPENGEQVIASDERLVLVRGNKISFFKFQPKQ